MKTDIMDVQTIIRTKLVKLVRLVDRDKFSRRKEIDFVLISISTVLTHKLLS